jgi:hypothetical protein
MQGEHHKITNSYLLLRVQLVSLNTVYSVHCTEYGYRQSENNIKKVPYTQQHICHSDSNKVETLRQFISQYTTKRISLSVKLFLLRQGRHINYQAFAWLFCELYVRHCLLH